ncbi:hypothetical protein IM792_09170 [Mucilaginibacter sp. JRF]|uniref:hypothetical protein n=1 Tax=Mucilaginibacter sp. JRF TaxID=2780088 RepID=UPI001882E0C3|nr:hypothetical protein [Mucilaginibacter sp. JRF]MBE9584614.1 hypothetical protein [Mucilaginibacter sp. JRF]
MTEPRIYTDAELKAKQAQDMAESVREHEQLKREKAQMITAQKIFDAATNMKAWVYDPEQKQWYTPEEFLKNTRGLIMTILYSNGFS